MNKTVMRLILGIMLICWMFIIFWFSNQPATESSEISGTISYRLVEDTDDIFNWGLTAEQIRKIAGNIEYPIRKAAHMTEYAILFLLSYLATVKISMSQSRFYNRSIAVLISLLYACSDEMHQLLVPGRSGKMIDVGIDMAGVLIVLICMILSKNTKWKIICGVLLGVLLVAAFVVLLFVPF